MTNFIEKALNGCDRNAIEECPFKAPEEIRALPYRSSPYFHRLLVGRHIGIYKPDETICAWTARILTQDKRYLQRSLGSAIDVGRGVISFETALQRAIEWFETDQIKGITHIPKPTGRMTSLRICPWGNEYSVGHALWDFFEWSKIARSEGGHYNNLVLANHHLVPLLSHVTLEEFNARHLKQLAIQVLETPPKYGFARVQAKVSFSDLSTDDIRRRKRTFNSLVTILRVAFRNAWDNGLIQSERPWRCLQRVSVVHTQRTIFLTRNECLRLLEHCTPALRRLVKAALYTGCRVGELGNLRVHDVAKEGYGIKISAFKYGPARFVFLPDEGMSFFLRQCEGKTLNDFVFHSDKGKQWKRQHTSLFKRAVARANLPKEFVFHGLRHTYASDLIKFGVSFGVVAKQLGHANTITVSNTYGHLAEREREEIIRSAFSPLCTEEIERTVEGQDNLNTVWERTQKTCWRDYARMAQTSSMPRKSYARTPVEVIQVFQNAESACLE